MAIVEALARAKHYSLIPGVTQVKVYVVVIQI